MSADYGINLDLNLIRVFVVVAEAGSVTRAASQLYLTQPAVSAALRRLSDAVGAPLFVRRGRGIALTSRGERLLAVARPHLASLVDAAMSPAAFDPKTSERTMRLGLSDASEAWLLPDLLRLLQREAPRIRLIVVPVQFRTVADAFASGSVDVALSVADDLPKSIRRRALFEGAIEALFDPRHVHVGARMTERQYFSAEHVIVSYAGDLRGIVEDELGRSRNVRVSVASFSNLGEIIEGTSLVATVPTRVSAGLRRRLPVLATARLPFSLPRVPVELLWSLRSDDDGASRFLRDAIERVVAGAPAPTRKKSRARAQASAK